jgi:mRNA-degrading endonuclease toxin of MazEF toxin-antitoxin module
VFTVDKTDLVEKIGTLPNLRVQEILAGIELLLKPRPLPDIE